MFPLLGPEAASLLQGSVSVYMALSAKGLITFKHQTMSKDGTQRLIGEARLPNTSHPRPPTTWLACQPVTAAGIYPRVASGQLAAVV